MKKIIALIAIIVIIVIFSTVLFFVKDRKNGVENSPILNNNENIEEGTKDVVENETETTPSDTSKEITEFDFSFLKMEQAEKNLIYSPLSIKYALKMLEVASTGEAKDQITKFIGNTMPTKYVSNENMSVANALFIRNTFQNDIKQSYIDTLKDQFDANVNYDSFEDASTINNWIKEKTLGIIPQMMSDEDVKELQFTLVNALAIDMEWRQKFLNYYDDDKNMNWWVEFEHEKLPNNEDGMCGYIYMPILDELKFNDKISVSSMEVDAAINKYDAVNELRRSRKNKRNCIC